MTSSSIASREISTSLFMKQGKTCLRKHCLTDSDYIIVHCSNKWSLGDLHANILKRAGYEITVSTTTAASGGRKLAAKFGASIAGVSLGACPGNGRCGQG
jgi:hypothetical protein